MQPKSAALTVLGLAGLIGAITFVNYNGLQDTKNMFGGFWQIFKAGVQTPIQTTQSNTANLATAPTMQENAQTAQNLADPQAESLYCLQHACPATTNGQAGPYATMYVAPNGSSYPTTGANLPYGR